MPACWVSTVRVITGSIAVDGGRLWVADSSDRPLVWGFIADQAWVG
jgi:hypothetical protein